MADSSSGAAPSFRTIIERSSDLLMLLRGDGTTSYVSPSVEALLGYTPAELVGRRNLAEVVPEDRDRVVRAFEQVQQRPGASVRVEFRFARRDGSPCWLECAATNLLEDPEVGAIVALHRDASARKRAEAEVLAHRTRLAEVLSATRAVTYICHAGGDCPATYVSDNVVEVIGHAVEDFLSCPTFWMDHLHPDDRARVLEAMPTPERPHVQHDYRFRCADGRYRWVRDAVSLGFDREGKPKEFVGYLVDIDAQKQAEAALRSSEEVFRKLIEQHPQAMLVRQGERVVRVNRALLRMLGYERPEDICGRPVVELVHRDDRSVVQQRMETAREGSYTPAAELHWVRRDGSSLVVETEALSLTLDGVFSTVVFARDLTERRQLLARMAVADRLASVGMLAAGVAHEINNPLAYLLNNLRVLAQSVPPLLRGEPTGRPPLRPEEVAQLIQDAQEGGARVAAVVRDLRTLSQADSGEVGATDACAALRSAVKMASSVVRQRAQIVERLAPVPPVRAREGRLVQVFLNLLVNAGQAIPEGAPERNRIEVCARLEPDGRVAVDIADTGEGISPELLPRIFEPFFTTKRAGEGTGLGLAICQSLVHAFGGEIRVRSQPGQGTTATVVLQAAEPARRGLTPVPQVEQGEGPRPRVLLIDDEVRFGLSLKLLLAPEYLVEPKTDARDALACIAAGAQYDVILCDLTMPEMDGMELHARLRERHPQLARRVIFLTGGAVTPRSREFLATTPQLCLQKPATHEALRAALEKVRQLG